MSSPALISPALDEDLLFRELLPDILAYCVRRVPNREDAADAAAEVLLVLWRRRGHLPGTHDEARRWAFGIARKTLQNARRGSRRRAALADAIAAQLPQPASAPTSIDLDLRRALDELRARDRELVLLVAWEGFSVADAGRALGLKPDAARARYSRARIMLRELLDAPSTNPGGVPLKGDRPQR